MSKTIIFDSDNYMVKITALEWINNTSFGNIIGR